jgi:hypothetical protein
MSSIHKINWNNSYGAYGGVGVGNAHDVFQLDVAEMNAVWAAQLFELYP